jgi:hypothetical protein
MLAGRRQIELPVEGLIKGLASKLGKHWPLLLRTRQVKRVAAVHAAPQLRITDVEFNRFG